VTLRGVFGSCVLLSRFVILVVVALNGFVELALSFVPPENPWFPRKLYYALVIFGFCDTQITDPNDPNLIKSI